jgi:hypothetical protein
VRLYARVMKELAPAYGSGFVDDHPSNEEKPRPTSAARDPI